MSEQEIFDQRLEKISQIKSKGINPYPTKFLATFLTKCPAAIFLSADAF